MLPQLQKEAKSKKRINERGVRDDVKPNWMKALKARMTYNAIICFLTILQTGWGDKKIESSKQKHYDKVSQKSSLRKTSPKCY